MTTRPPALLLGIAAAGLAVSSLTGCFVRVGPPPPPEPAPAAVTPAPAATPAAATPTGPTEGTPIVCSGSGTQELSNVVIKAPATPVITASGTCKIVLKNPTLQGPVTILASDTAEIRIEGGTVTGAITASGKANITMKGVKATGPFNKTGQAVINVM